MADGRIAYHLLWFKGSGPSLGSERPNISCFVGLEADNDENQAILEKFMQAKLKDRAEELVE